MPLIILSVSLSEVIDIGRLASQLSVVASPHNPYGLTMNIMTDHVAIALPVIEAMERPVA